MDLFRSLKVLFFIDCVLHQKIFCFFELDLLGLRIALFLDFLEHQVLGKTRIERFIYRPIIMALVFGILLFGLLINKSACHRIEFFII